MSSQALDFSVSEAAEILKSLQFRSALAADKPIVCAPALPSPARSATERVTTLTSAGQSAADRAYSFISPSKTLPTPQSSRRSTRNCPTPIENKENTSYQNTRQSSNGFVDESTDDEGEAATTTTTTTRDITCHGNTYVNLVPHAGSACWELTQQTDPASIGAQPTSSTPTLEDHDGELDCRRCRVFKNSRTAAFATSRSKRERTVPLTEEAQDSSKRRRVGAAEYDDAYHESYRCTLRKEERRQRKRYVRFHTMTPETRAQRVAERAVRLERQREAPFERAWREMRRACDAETARIRAENKAEYEREKAMAVARPRVSFAAYLASLPMPDLET